MSDQAELLSPDVAPVATPSIYEMLRKRHEGGEWVLLEEVAPNTGGGTRYADAVAINLWSSRGHAICGFEVKVSRGDWLRELKQPEKAEPVFRYCDTWWIVAPKGVVKDGELPPTWGLLEPRGNTLAVSVAAKKLEPVPVTRAFFASLVRRAFEQVDRRAANLVQSQLSRARTDQDKAIAEGIARATRRSEELAEKVRRFEAETGIAISGYSGPPIEMVKLAKKLGELGGYQGEPLERLADLANDLQRMAVKVNEVVEASGLRQPAAAPPSRSARSNNPEQTRTQRI